MSQISLRRQGIFFKDLRNKRIYENLNLVKIVSRY